MTQSVRWGVVAPGGIADVVTADLLLVRGAEVLAVSSRALPRAQEFAEKHGIPRAYGSTADLLADPDVDVVYVATPHAQHHEVARAALLAGKHVLCEKAFTLTLADAQDLVDLARERNLFLMEAMWTRFNPLVRRIKSLVAEGAIGEVRAVHADFGFTAAYDPSHRLWNPALGGGALLDLGVYPVSFTHMLLGEPESITVHGSLAPSGVDADVALLLAYANGAHGLLTCSLTSTPEVSATIVGSGGRIDVPEPFFNPSAIVVNGVEERVELEGTGYTYQLTEVTQRVAAGYTESPEMTLDDTLAVMRTLTTALDALGVSYENVR
ncbi:Gfo/Idh/MocA family protein [Umezawaea endophytica]|uniref:Gfo/Idh/MocA family oxidoreductase n=1 Tax=Umezawaea endophytica TaxID=1654476 RepID=A0A9X2VLJ9_9PSEU|nr:Gfo/Idh/MocA family oxidoreductase [Umezawaea endophytica]MCS7478923.1 Gfo/Idh/MocA family oxidoreductase [Umezawaea endophytica]